MGKRIFGLLIILAGVLLLLDNLNIYPIKDLFGYLWPSALFLIGLFSMIELVRVNLFHLVLVLVGGVFLAINAGLIEKEAIANLILPAILVLFGLSLVFSRPSISVRVSDKDNVTAIFGSTRHKSNIRQFEKLEVSAVFGSADVDLSEVELVEDRAKVIINAVFGNAEVRFPKKYHVKIVSGDPVFGGFENKISSSSFAEDAKVIEVTYSVVFGRIEIRD